MTYGTPSATSTLGSTCAGGAAEAVPAAKAGTDSLPSQLPHDRSPATGLAQRVKLTERQVQEAVWQQLQYRAKGGLNRLGGVIACHPKNGGIHQASIVQRLANAKQGVLPGIPDLILWDQFGKSYWLELKAIKGKLSADQQSLAHVARRNGITTACAYGLDDAIAILERWRLLEGRTI